MELRNQSDELSINVVQAASLMQETTRSIRDKVACGKLKGKTVERTDGRGITYEIPLSSLPTEARTAYWAQEAQKLLQGTPVDFDVHGYSEKHGELGMRKLLDKHALVVQAQEIRLQAQRNTLEQLKALANEHGISERTLYRMEKAYKAEGLAGLARDARSDAGKSRSMCLEAQRFVCEQYLNASKKAQNSIFEQLIDRANDLGPRGCDECPYNPASENYVALHNTDDGIFFPACDRVGNGIIVPERRYSVNRVIDGISNEEKTYMRKGRKAWEAKYMMKATRAKPSKVNEAWYGDHHQFDVFVIDEKGKLCRPWLTVWYDIGSGVLVGWCISTNPNSETIVQAFVRAISEKNNSVIRGVPVWCCMDNGRDYRGERFEGSDLHEYEIQGLNDSLSTSGILKVLHVAAEHAKPYHGWVKPVERFFGTLERKYCSGLPGYCGGKPEDRPENFTHQLKVMHERGELLTLDELSDIFMNDILPAYHNRPHDGYKGQTPYERYMSLPRARSDQPGWQTLSMVMKERAERVVSTQGITFEGTLYWHENLRHMVGDRVILRYSRGDTRSMAVINRAGYFVCMAEPKAYFKHVGEDEGKVAAHMALQKKQETEVRMSIRARGVKLPGKRASGNMFYEAVDEAARGNLCDFQAAKAAQAQAEVERKREARELRNDEAENSVRAMLREMGDKVLGAK